MVSGNCKRWLRIGVDVGGTNTDGVVLDPLASTSGDKGIIAWHKTPTTPDPSQGITKAIEEVITAAGIQTEDLASITIGTTHFVNAVLERDPTRLSKVAVIRLCGPFSKHTPPCIDWPSDTRDLILGHYALLKGGLEVDGALIADIDEDEIKAECTSIQEKGISNVVVVGVFSPIDTKECQEERAAAIIRAQLPGCHVLCSREVANIGFLERENASILNASILSFARRTIDSFQKSVLSLGLRCPVFITQNDGTLLPGDVAARLPILTFSSGPTNSMRGAAFLAKGVISEAMIVIDIGGTTTDVGYLQENGFPRQQAAYSELVGVRMNFSCPDIKSIALGGGSIVRKDNGITVGPDSVGSKLYEKSMVFGGGTLTATDCTVLANSTVELGQRERVRNMLAPSEVDAYKAYVRTRLEDMIDKMKTRPEDLTVLLVGGGAMLSPDQLKGAKNVIKPRWAGIANAIGAALARVSVVVDVVRSTESKPIGELLREVSQEAIEMTVAVGALRSTVEVVEQDTLPLQPTQDSTPTTALHQDLEERQRDEHISSRPRSLEQVAPTKLDISLYRPKVTNRIWYISETDLDWITTGCYILGTGGGGSPYTHMIRLRSELRCGATVRVVSPFDLKDDDQVGSGGGIGSPTVSIEKLAADEMVEAQEELRKICGLPVTHVISLEIGGANGLQGLILGASSCMDVPVVDGDWMGRAYPTKWQTTPVVFDERRPIWCPVTMSDGNDNVIVVPKATSDLQVECILRAALTQMGSHAGCADPPVTGAETKRWVVEHTISQAWRIGRGIARARQENRLQSVAETIIEECGGPQAAKILWKGKIVGVERTLKSGYVYGECIIEATALDHGGDSQPGDHPAPRFRGSLKIPFKNENIAALRMRDDGAAERQEDVIAIVPDLITVIDVHSGEAVGTPEYRYGLLVVVLGLAASDKWTKTRRGLQLGGPEGFDLGHLKYAPLGRFVAPRSVVDEFDVSF